MSAPRSEPGDPDVLDVAARDLIDTPDAGPAAIRGGLLRTAGYAAGILITLASAPLLIRHLGVVDFGRYVTIMSLVTLVGGLTELGISAIGLREFAVLEAAARDRLLRNLLGVRLLVTVVGVLAAIAFAALAGYGASLVLGTALAGLGLLLSSTQLLLGVGLMGSLRFGWVTAAELTRQVVTVSLIVTLVVLDAGVVAFLAVPIPASFAALLMTVVLVRGVMPLRPTFHVGQWVRLLRTTIAYAAATAVNIVYFRVVVIIMSLQATAVQTGYFATSFRVIEMVLGVPGLVVSAVFPIFARAARDDLKRLSYAVGRVLEVSIIAGVWIALCFVLGADTVIHILAGSDSDPSIAVLRIQSLAVIATFLAMAGGFALLALGLYRPLLVANILALGVSVALTLVLVPPLEARGGAVATLAAEAGLAVVTLAALARTELELRVPLRLVFAVLLGAGLGLATWLVPAPEVARVIVASLLYFGTLAVLRQIPQEAIEALAGLLRRPARSS